MFTVQVIIENLKSRGQIDGHYIESSRIDFWERQLELLSGSGEDIRHAFTRMCSGDDDYPEQVMACANTLKIMGYNLLLENGQ